MFRRRRHLRRRLLTTSTLALVLLTFPHFSVAEVPTLAELKERVQESLRRVGQRDGVVVEPKAVSVFVSEIYGRFVTNFCYPFNSEKGRRICAATVQTDAVMDEVLGTYIAELVTRQPARIESLAARLAIVAGGHITQAGFLDGTQKNILGLVDVPPAFRNRELIVVTARGRQVLGRNVLTVIAAPGPLTIFATKDRDVVARGRALVRARVRVGVRQDRSRHFVAPINVALDRYCRNDSRPPITEYSGTFNFGRAAIVEPAEEKLANLAPMFRKSLLSVDVIDQTGSCGKRCRRGLSIALAEAVIVWLQGCGRCTRHALAFLQVGDDIWLMAALPTVFGS